MCIIQNPIEIFKFQFTCWITSKYDAELHSRITFSRIQLSVLYLYRLKIQFNILWVSPIQITPHEPWQNCAHPHDHADILSEHQRMRRPPPNTGACELQRSQKPQYREETQTHMHAVIQEAMRPTSKNIILISTRPQQGVRKQVGCITTQSQLQNVTGTTHAHTHFYRHTCSTSWPHVSTAMLWKHSEHLINSCALTQCRHKLTNTFAFKWETVAETLNYRHPDTNNTNRQRCTQTRERRHLRHQHKHTETQIFTRIPGSAKKKNSRAQTGKNAKYVQKG